MSWKRMLRPPETPLGKRAILMAKKTVLVSDISGKEITDPKHAARVTITYGDARKGSVVLDVLATEVDDIASKGLKQARRRRKPKSA